MEEHIRLIGQESSKVESSQRSAVSDDDDAASLAIKQLVKIFILATALWQASFVIITVELVLYKRFTIRDWILFLPMWLGSLIGCAGSVLTSCRLYRNAKLIPRDRRLYMIAQGIHENQAYIDFESLPIMRTLFCWSFVGGTVFFTSFISQLIFFHWFNHPIRSIYFEFLVPIVIVLASFAVYMFLMSVFSIKACILAALGIVEVVLFSLKTVNGLQSWSWDVVLSPLLVILAVLAADLGLWWRSVFLKTVVLSKAQKISLSLYTLSWSLLASGSVVYLVLGPNGHPNDIVSHVCWTVAVPVAVVAAQVTMYREAVIFAETRGFRKPLALARTSDGWEPVLSGNPLWSWWLGEVQTVGTTARDVESAPSSLHNAPTAVISYQSQETYDSAQPKRKQKKKKQTQREIELSSAP